MFTALLFAAPPILNIEVGNAYQIVAQIDCEVRKESIDMNGAPSTVSVGSGKKKVSLFLTTLWPASNNSKIGVLAFETQGGETTLGELTYDSEYVPTSSKEPQPPLVLTRGEATWYALTPRDDPKGRLWDYEESQVLVHGAIQTRQGICELKDMGK